MKMSPLSNVLQIHRGDSVGNLLVCLFLKSNDPHCDLFSQQGWNASGLGAKHPESFETTPFKSKEKAF